MLIDIYIKFCEDSLTGFQVIEQTRVRQTDRQMDRQSSVCVHMCVCVWVGGGEGGGGGEEGGKDTWYLIILDKHCKSS